jgi:hypothetical protein
MNKVLVYLFCGIWSILNCYVGIQELMTMLGGVFLLYMALPLCAVFCLGNRMPYRIPLQLIFTFAGIIAANYIYMYYMHTQTRAQLVVYMHIIWIQVSLIVFGVIYGVDTFMFSTNDATYEGESKVDMIRAIRRLYASSLFIPLTITCPIVGIFVCLTQHVRLHPIQKLVLVLASLITGMLYL